MDMDNSVGIDCGSWGGGRMSRGGKGGKIWDNYNRITIKNLKINSIKCFRYKKNKKRKSERGERL